ncbi:MAG: hypothetical protein IJ255_04575, partial [Bacteroidales bacterium]|nr:hypothetical protein [Bacteroidales bacterium]
MESKLLKGVLLLAAGLLGFHAAAQEISVRMVSADSLVSVMRSVSGNKIYLAAGGDDVSFYTVTASAASFRDAALEKFRANGYSVSEYDGCLYLIRGRALQASLPANWFAREQSATEEKIHTEEDALTATYLNKIYEIGDERRAREGLATIHGKIRDVATGEPVPGITVSDSRGRYAMSDIYGDWRLQTQTGRNALTFNGYPMEDVTLE